MSDQHVCIKTEDLTILKEQMKVANHRLEDLEATYSMLMQMNSALQVLISKMDVMEKSLAKVVDVPEKRWETVITVLITAVITALVVRYM